MKNIFLFVLFAVFLAGCASTKPTMTPLQIQSMQSRDFESNLDVVFPSVLSVLQDMGYTITNADKATGIINAESAALSNAALKFWTGNSSVAQTRATGFVEQIGKTVRVRVSFVETKQTSSAWGQSDRNDKPILVAEIYQNVFEQIENAIFIRSAS